MTRKGVADDSYGRLWRKMGELARRVDEGTLDEYEMMKILQHTIEGKMSKLISSGGLVLTNLELVIIEVGPSIREELSRLDKSFPCHNPGKTKLKVGTLRYVRFADGDKAPGTKRILRDMEDNGVCAGTAKELLATARSQPFLVNSWGEYTVALGSATRKGGNLRYFHQSGFPDQDRFGKVDVAENGLSAPWWPSCYSFFVVKDV